MVNAMNVLDGRTRKILADPENRHAWVIYELRVKGLTLFDLARDAGVTRQAVYTVWQRRYPRMQALIAAALDMRPQDLFPDRYDDQGVPLKWLGGKRAPLTRGKDTTRKKQSNGKRKTKKNHEPESQAA